jgi:hypothetical protein
MMHHEVPQDSILGVHSFSQKPEPNELTAFKHIVQLLDCIGADGGT